MRKYVKIISVLLLVIQIVFLLQTVVLADNFDFTEFDNYGNNKIDKRTKNVMATAINVIRVVGTGVSLIMLSYLGIKYMMASPNEKADFKKSAMIYVVGAVLVFGASNLLSIILNASQNLFE